VKRFSFSPAIIALFQNGYENFHREYETLRVERGIKEAIQRRESFDFDAQAYFLLEPIWDSLQINLVNALDVWPWKHLEKLSQYMVLMYTHQLWCGYQRRSSDSL
jgi:hypothetical protein